VAGKLVRNLVDETAEAGTHQAVWDGRDERGNRVASGVYLYRLQGENERATKKLIFVR
jgi:flagellar hook assembly protein FlgD